MQLLVKKDKTVIKRKNKFNIYFKLFKIFSVNYWKSFAGPFYTFALPLFFMIIFYFIFKDNGWNYVHGHDMIGIYILWAAISAGFLHLNNRIAEWKASVFLKRLDATPLKKWEFLFIIIVHYAFISILGTIWMLIWAMIINPKYQISNWQEYTNWGYVVLGIILTIMLCTSMAVLISGLVKSIGAAHGIGMMIYFPSLILSGLMIPLQDISSIINYFGYFIPLKYSITVFMHGWWYYSTIPANQNGYTLETAGFNAIWQPIVGALGFFIIIFIISSFTFKFQLDKN